MAGCNRVATMILLVRSSIVSSSTPIDAYNRDNKLNQEGASHHRRFPKSASLPQTSQSSYMLLRTQPVSQIGKCLPG